MKIEYLHASKYGNGAAVAEEFRKEMATKGAVVDVHHIRDVSPTQLEPADLYVFSSPGRMGKPIRGMRRFLKQVTLPAGTKYAILTTEAAARPDKTGHVPTDEEVAKWQHVRPVMNEILQGEGLVQVAEGTVHVTKIKGPLEEAGSTRCRPSSPPSPSRADRTGSCAPADASEQAANPRSNWEQENRQRSNKPSSR